VAGIISTSNLGNRMTDPILFAFRCQKSEAKRRGIVWDMPYWEWLQIWQESGRLSERGRRGGQWVMARRGDQGAYERKNVSIARVETNNREAQFTRWGRLHAASSPSSGP
jgi:hypothetical protein